MDIWERLKEENKLDVVAHRLGYTINWTGNWGRSAGERSWLWNRERGYYYRNKGDTGGTVIDLLVNEHGMTLQEAGETLADWVGIPFYTTDEERATAVAQKEQRDVMAALVAYLQKALVGPALKPDWDGAMLDLALAHNAAGAHGSAGAVEYCQSRGWDLQTVIDARLGYWDGNGAALKDAMEVAGIDRDHPVVVALAGLAGTPEQSVAAWAANRGVDVESKPKWTQYNRILGARGPMLIYPHVRAGRVEYFSGRSMDERAGEEDDMGRFVPKSYNPPVELVGPRKPFWNHAAKRLSGPVVVVEGQADGVTLAMWGQAAVATCGVQGDGQLFGRVNRFDSLLFGFDNDRAGWDATRRWAKELGGHHRVVEWAYDDANRCLQRGWTADTLANAMAGAPAFVVLAAERLKTAKIEEIEDAHRDLYERLASLSPYQFETLVADVAKGMDSSVSDVRRIVKAVVKERKTAATTGAGTAAGLSPSGGKLEHLVQNFSIGLADVAALDPDIKEKLSRLPADHEGHAQAVLALYPDQLAYVPQWGWLTYDGQRWNQDKGEQLVETMVTNTLRARQLLATESQNESLVKASFCRRPNVVHTREQLKAHVVKSTADFDNRPDYINAQNGVVDLANGDLLPHGPGWRFTYVLGTAYNPMAVSHEWLDFLEDVLNPEIIGGGQFDVNTMVAYVQRAVGYSLSGHATEECLFYLHGPTRSGKGTFMGTLLELMGSMAAGIDFQTLIADRAGDTQNFDLAALKNKNMVTASESGKYARLNTEKVKQVTGQDPVRCSFKHRDHFEYVPKFKIWLQSNNPINLDVHDDAAWGRVHVIEFPKSHLNKEDTTLKDRLKSTESLEGVLAWAVEGAMAWYEARADLGRGLMVPQMVKDATEKQRHEQDFLAHFIGEELAVADPNRSGVFEPVNRLYSRYEQWAKVGGVTKMRARAFSMAFKAKGYKLGKKYVNKKQQRVVFGVELVDDTPAGVGVQRPIFGGDTRQKDK